MRTRIGNGNVDEDEEMVRGDSAVYTFQFGQCIENEA